MAFEFKADAGIEAGAKCAECGTWHAAAALCPRCALAFALDDGEPDSEPAETLEGDPAAALATPSAAPVPPPQFAHFTLEHDAAGHPVELGRGGMGVTYLATDRHLRIKVALKVIAPSRVGDRAAQALFFREARAAAKVRHSHVASVLYLSEPPGNVFYAMEFVPGESLRKWIERHAPVPPLLAIALAEQIARGLGAIHHEGIVHRDLKPGNVMLVPAPRSSAAGPMDPLSPDAWHAKIIDFGLARAVAKEDDYVSTIGFRGTALYASPEQCEERHDLDGRADLYSLGCILFELLTGALPFKARTHRELMNLHVSSAPPLERLEHLPASLTAIVARLLVKDPDDRFADAEALVKALGWARGKIERGGELDGASPAPRPRVASRLRHRPATQHPPGVPNPFSPTPELAPSARTAKASHPRSSKPFWMVVGLLFLIGLPAALVLSRWKGDKPDDPSSPKPPGPVTPASRASVAVLPFANLSPDPQNAYLADGMHEDLVTSLAKVRDLKVIARTSVLRFRADAQRDAPAIGAQLGVKTLVEGSLRRDGSRIRITAQLVRADTGEHLWAETFDRDLTDLFAIQSQVVFEITNALQVRLTTGERARLALAPPRSSDAYSLFVRARALMGKAFAPRQEMDEATRLLDEALESDPSFAPAHAQLSLLHTLYYAYGRDHTDHRLGLALKSAESARHLAPEATETLLAFGNFYYRGYRDYARAMPYFQKVLEVAPGNVDALTAVGLIERRQGKWEAGLEKLQRAGEASPLDVALHYNVANTLMYLRRHEEAARHVEAAIRRIGRNPILASLRGEIYLGWKGALSAMQEALADRAPRDLPPELAVHEQVRLLLLEGKADAAVKLVQGSSFSLIDGQLLYVTRQSLLAEALGQAGESAAARAAWESARKELEPLAATRPADPRVRAAHAFALAGCGRKSEALAEAQAALELSPLEQDAFDGAHYLECLGLIQLRCGDAAQAGDTMGRLLRIPSRWTKPLLRVSPEWKSLPELK